MKHNIGTAPATLAFLLISVVILFMLPPLGIGLMCLWAAYGIAIALSHHRTPEQKAEEARAEQIRFHLRGSVRHPEPPRPPARERLY